MALTGKFEADFSSYVDETHKSIAAAKDWEDANHRVEKSVDDMVNTSGRLSAPAANLRLVKGAASEAATAAAGAGKAAQEAGQLAETSSRGFSTMGHTVAEVGHALDLFGIDLGPTAPIRRGLVSIGELIERAGPGMSALAEAGAAAGAAIAGWELGRTIAEVTDLDDKIGDLTRKMLGLPTVAEQSAEATAKAIADAQKKYPNIPITSFSDVVALREGEAADAIAKNKDASDMTARIAAVAAVDKEIQKVNADLQKIRDSGVEQDLIRQINSHAVSLKDLADQYHISMEAMSQFETEAAHAASVEAGNKKKLDDLALELAHADQDRRQAADDAEKKRLADESAQIDADTKAANARKENNYQELVAQKAARDATEAETLALFDQADAARAAAGAVAHSNTFDLSTSSGRALFKQLNPQATLSAPAEYFASGKTLADAIADGYLSLTGGSVRPYTAPATGGTGSTGTGATAPAAPSAAPPAAAPPAAAAGIQIYAPIHVSGVFDPSSAHALSRVVSTALATSLTNARTLGGWS